MNLRITINGYDYVTYAVHEQGLPRKLWAQVYGSRNEEGELGGLTTWLNERHPNLAHYKGQK